MNDERPTTSFFAVLAARDSWDFCLVPPVLNAMTDESGYTLLEVRKVLPIDMPSTIGQELGASK